jgi:hypothetical protein
MGASSLPHGPGGLLQWLLGPRFVMVSSGTFYNCLSQFSQIESLVAAWWLVWGV